MGQKVHPLGFRVGITKKHQSQWFARFHKNSYAQSILEDRMLRNTLIKLFPELLNPVLKKIQNRQQEKKVTPKITQIKIERGLIPYEIGIQIHAQNCKLIKSAIDKLKINRDLACYLQKTKKFLNFLGQSAKLEVEKLKSQKISLSNQDVAESHLVLPKKKTLKRVKIRGQIFKSNLSKQRNTKKSFGRKKNISFKRGGKRRNRLTKSQYKRKKLIQRRLRRRQNLRSRFSEFISKGLLIYKKTNEKRLVEKSITTADVNLQSSKSSLQIIQRKIKSKKKKLYRFKQKNFVKSLGKKQNQINNQLLPPPVRFLKNKKEEQNIVVKSNLNKVQITGKNNSKIKVKNQVFIQLKKKLRKKIQKKILTIYLNKMNKKFLKDLKLMIKNCQLQLSTNEQSIKSNNLFGYYQKWDLQKLKSFRIQPIPKLMKLIQILEKKIREKMEGLKKYFIIFGCLSKTQVYSFYQIMTFLKSLKRIVRQRFIYLRLRLRFGLTHSKLLSKNIKQKKESKIKSNKNKLTLQNSNMKKRNMRKQKVLLKIVKHLHQEGRKIKFIEYLKQTLQKHRTKNIFYYLSTLAKASQDLKQTKNFTIKNAKFLFGLDLKNLNSTQEENVINENILKDRVTTILEQSNRNKIYGGQDLEQALRDSLINQIEREKLINKENLKLTPKISIKFYSVKKESIDIKASVAAESIVDALEKRKAFRKVIKDTKSDLMKAQRVKGVKIQVAGRLNGAEIARTEWVRAGRVPLQTLRANIDFSYKTANTIYGIIGVKVWIFKGYTKTI